MLLDHSLPHLVFPPITGSASDAISLIFLEESLRRGMGDSSRRPASLDATGGLPATQPQLKLLAKLVAESAVQAQAAIRSGSKPRPSAEDGEVPSSIDEAPSVEAPNRAEATLSASPVSASPLGDHQPADGNDAADAADAAGGGVTGSWFSSGPEAVLRQGEEIRLRMESQSTPRPGGSDVAESTTTGARPISKLEAMYLISEFLVAVRHLKTFVS